METNSVPLVTPDPGESLLRSRLSLRETLSRTAWHFMRRLRQTPLLAGWLFLGLFVAFFLDGGTGLLYGLTNLALIAVYALLIRILTLNPPAPVTVKRPRLELAIAIGLFGLFLLIQLLDFGVWTPQPLQGWVRAFFADVQGWVAGSEAIPTWARQDVFLAASSTIKNLLPILIAFWFLRSSPRTEGLAHPHWKLSAVLVGSAALLGGVSGILLRAPLVQVLGLYLVGIFVNALPEELFFRGFLLARLSHLLRNPLNALVISALFFNAMHIPIEMYHGATPWKAILGVFSTAYPSGLIWGYLYLRTRSIIPGTLWHAANLNLGFLLMSS